MDTLAIGSPCQAYRADTEIQQKSAVWERNLIQHSLQEVLVESWCILGAKISALLLEKVVFILSSSDIVSLL